MDLLDEFLDLSEDPELAFVEFEQRKRRDIEDYLFDEEGDLVHHIAMEYVSEVMGVHDGFSLRIIDNPKLSRNEVAFGDKFRKFQDIVFYQTIRIRSSHARRLRSVRVVVSLNSEEQKLIQEYIENIRDIVRPVEMRPGKKEAILKRLDELSNEIERDRTKVEAFTATSLEIATEIDRHSSILKPVKSLLEKIEYVFASAKDFADQLKLGVREVPKLLTGPRSQDSSPSQDFEASEQSDGDSLS